ncbi:MAG TPA: type II secretion system protein [Tepidisphaeraceae bacterium]|nr:type II secretion system protein [Tepidisphaeraceae bacterium]
MSSRYARHGGRRAFTLLEAVVILAILGILASIFVPYVLNVREMNNRVRCAENFRLIKLALDQYGRENRNEYPSVRHDVDKPGWTAFTGGNVETDPFAEGSAVAADDVTASLYLLVRGGMADPKLFICPSVDRAAAAASFNPRLGNFSSRDALTYSYATPFSSLPEYHLNSDRVRAEFALMADMNPGTAGSNNVTTVRYEDGPALRSMGNSLNHGQAGQNVLFGDGHVEWSLTQFCGVNNDNIYTALQASPVPPGAVVPPTLPGVLSTGVGPAWYSDSVLVPTATEPQ